MRLSLDVTTDDLAEAIFQMDQAEIVELIMKIDVLAADSAFTADLYRYFKEVYAQDQQEMAEQAAAVNELKAVQVYNVL